MITLNIIINLFKNLILNYHTNGIFSYSFFYTYLVIFRCYIIDKETFV